MRRNGYVTKPATSEARYTFSTKRYPAEKAFQVLVAGINGVLPVVLASNDFKNEAYARTYLASVRQVQFGNVCWNASEFGILKRVFKILNINDANDEKTDK
jgi:hypothetical protein